MKRWKKTKNEKKTYKPKVRKNVRYDITYRNIYTGGVGVYILKQLPDIYTRYPVYVKMN